MVVFKKRDSVPSARYSSVCNVLRQWRIWIIPTYRVVDSMTTDSMIMKQGWLYIEVANCIPLCSLGISAAHSTSVLYWDHQTWVYLCSVGKPHSVLSCKPHAHHNGYVSFLKRQRMMTHAYYFCMQARCMHSTEMTVICILSILMNICMSNNIIFNMDAYNYNN